jgi:hypothetical protein
MLPDRYSRLLTAYVDGELSPQKHKTVGRLLRKSARARALLRDLESDSRRLRALPAPAPAPDLSPRVLRTIDERGLRPAPATPAAPAPAAVLPGWLGVAVAAAVLLAVTAASYLCFSQLREGQGEQPVLVREEPRAEPPAPVRQGPRAGPPAPVSSAFRVALGRLEQEPERRRLAAELHKKTAYHLSLSCKDSGKAVEGLRRAFGSQQITLLVDPQALRGPEPRGPRRTYLLYAENLLPEELAAILQQLGVEVRKSVGQGPLADTVVVSDLTGDHRQVVARLLGVAPEKRQPPGKARAADASPPSLGEPLIQGPPARAEQAPRRPAAAERFAVIVAADAAGRPGPEILQYLQHRRQQRPGTVQVLLVLEDART